MELLFNNKPYFKMTTLKMRLDFWVLLYSDLEIGII